MPVGGKPTVRSRRVGSELRRLREAADVTTAQAAEMLSCSPAKISRIENGIVSVRVVDLRLLLDRYGDQDQEHRAYLERLARESNKRGWWQDYGDTIPPYYADFIGLEADASYIKTWEPTAIPGLLQTPEYARAIMLANPAMISPDKLDNFLSVRRERQSRLEDGTGVRFDAVVWEAALLTTVGDAAIQKAQLERLADLTKRPNISVQVLPLEAGDHASMSGSFVLFSFGRGQVGGLWVDDAVVRLPRSRFSRSRLPFQSPLRHRGALLYLTRRGVLNIKRGSCCANSL